MHEISDFLRGFPPFDAATQGELEVVEAATQIAFFASGSSVLRADEQASEHAYVLRTGHADLVDGGRVIDVLGPGDVVGVSSMLTAMPPGLDVRAAEDLLVYRIDAEAMLPLFSRRSGLRFVAETVRRRTPSRRIADPLIESSSPILTDIARPAVVVEPSVSIRDVVQQMHDLDASSAMAMLGDGTFGIMTDHDLRNRVLAAGQDLGDPLSTVMTHPARTVPAETTADDAVLVMLTHGIRHLPVLDSAGTLVGVVEEVDLLAAQERTPLRLRRSIARAGDLEELARVSTALIPAILEASRSGRAPARVTASYSVLVESVIGRVIALCLAGRGNPPVPFAWLMTGSLSRREMVPSSDVDSLIAWEGPDDDADIREWMWSFTAEVLDAVSRCGIRHDTNGVRADDPRFARSADAWQAAVAHWARDPTMHQGDIYLAALLDATPCWGDRVWMPVRREIETAVRSPLVRRVFARIAVAHRPPTGFVRDLVIAASGEHRGTFDIKAGCITPVVDIGRYLAAMCGSPLSDTLGRLEAARGARLLSSEDVDDLSETFLLLTAIRVDHQAALIARGGEPDDHVAPGDLASLSRRHLREALRVVSRAQREINAGLAGWRQ